MSRQHFPIGLDLYNQDIKDLKIFPQETASDANTYLGSVSGKIVYSKENTGVHGRLKYRSEAGVETLATLNDVGSSTLAGLIDTNIVNAANAQVLIYDPAGSGAWTNRSISGDATISFTGALTLNVVPVTKGGTGLHTIAQGSILIASSANTLAALGKSTTVNQFLKNGSSGNNNNPIWSGITYNDITGPTNLTFLNLSDTPGSYTNKAVARSTSSGVAWDTNGVFTDQANTYGEFDQIFRSSRLQIRNPADSHSYTIVAGAITASRTLNIPVLTATDTLMTVGTNQDITHEKRFNHDKFILRDSTAKPVRFILDVQGGSSGIVNIPNLNNTTSTILFESLSQTVINKTISAYLNTIIGQAGADQNGDLLVYDTTKYQRFSRGSENTVLKSTSGGLVWGSIHWNELIGTQPLPTAHAINGEQHTLSGATSGTFMKATSSTTFGFVEHGLITTDIPEGSNLYFTNDRVILAPLTGYVEPSSAWLPLTGTDTVLGAFVKVQASLFDLNDKIESGVQYLSNADVVFSSTSTSLPTNTSTQIDVITVTNGFRVLVLDSATPAQINNIYTASVAGSTITWSSPFEPTEGNALWVASGVSFGGTTWYYTGTEWVKIGGASSYYSSEFIGIANNVISLNPATEGFQIIARTGSGAGSFERLSATSNTVLKHNGTALVFSSITNSDISATADITIGKIKGTLNRFVIGGTSGRLIDFSAGSSGQIIRRGGSAPEWTPYTLPSTASSDDVFKVLSCSANNVLTLGLISNANIAGGAAITWGKLAVGTADQVLITNASGVISSMVSLNVPRGGTGRSTLTAHNLLVGADTSQVTFIAPGESGYFLRSNGTSWESSAWPLPTSIGAEGYYLKVGSSNTTVFAPIALSELPARTTKSYVKTLGSPGSTVTVLNGEHGFSGNNDYIVEVMLWINDGSGYRKYNCDFHINRTSGANYNLVTVNTGGSGIQWTSNSYLVITSTTIV